MKVVLAVIFLMMLVTACIPTDSTCIRLVKENERLTERNYKLARAAFGRSDGSRMIYLNDPHYRASATQTIINNNKQIEVNSKLIAIICVKDK